MSEGFRMPAGPGESELTEKRSHFLGHLIPVESEEEAKEFVSQVKKQYHDARHNCWCYRIYNGPERFSDDGEPQGSAGMPMLEVFRREEVFNFCCVVTGTLAVSFLVQVACPVPIPGQRSSPSPTRGRFGSEVTQSSASPVLIV